MARSSAGKPKDGKPAVLKIKFSASGHRHQWRTAKAYSGPVVAGFFLFKPEQELIKAHGTEVRPRFQKKGIGSALWEATIKKYKPKSISVSTVSESGERLVRKMKARHPEIEWDWW